MSMAVSAIGRCSATNRGAGHYVTLPVGSNVLPGETLVWNALDSTVSSDVKPLGEIVASARRGSV